MSLAEWLRISTNALDSLIRIPSVAVAETQTYAERRAADAEYRLWLQIGLLSIGILVGGAGFVFAQRRVIAPIRAISVTMGRLAQGDLAVAISSAGRRDEIGEIDRVCGCVSRWDGPGGAAGRGGSARTAAGGRGKALGTGRHGR